MALLKYCKLKISCKQLLPSPNGELSAKIGPSSSISSTNACVGKLLDGDGTREEQDSGRLAQDFNTSSEVVSERIDFHSLRYRWRSVFGERVDFQLNNFIWVRYRFKAFAKILSANF